MEFPRKIEKISINLIKSDGDASLFERETDRADKFTDRALGHSQELNIRKRREIEPIIRLVGHREWLKGFPISYHVYFIF